MTMKRDECIDYSCMHNVLIRHKDGTLTPMDEQYYDVKEIAPGTWQLMSSGDYHYLLAGDGEGICIDTGYGAGNLRTFCEGLAGMPVPNVISTHDHFDHTALNSYFDAAYMDPGAIPLAALPYDSFAGITFPREYESRPVTDGSIIPLPGRPLEIFSIPDHTDNGIAILDRKERILFVGDEMMPFGKILNGSPRRFNESMKKIYAVRDEFDRIFGGPGEVPKKILEAFMEASERMLAGEGEVPKNDRPHGMPPVQHDEQGRIIYDCQMPRPGDGGMGKPKPADWEPPVMLRVGDYMFGYQPHKLKE